MSPQPVLAVRFVPLTSRPGPSSTCMGVGEVGLLGGLPLAGFLGALLLLAPRSFLSSLIPRAAMTWCNGGAREQLSVAPSGHLV